MCKSRIQLAEELIEAQRMEIRYWMAVLGDAHKKGYFATDYDARRRHEASEAAHVRYREKVQEEQLFETEGRAP